MIKVKRLKDLYPVQIRVPKNVHRNVKSIAAERGITVSGMYRNLIESGAQLLEGVAESRVELVKKSGKGKR